MKLTSLLIITLLTTVQARAAAPVDVIAEHYFPPDLVDAASEHIGLGEELHQKLREHMAKVQPRFQELQERVEREMKELVRVSSPSRVDEEAVLAQVDKLQAAERELKRLQLKTLASIKNHLSAEQQEKLRVWKREHAGEMSQEFRSKLQERLQNKMKQVQDGLAEWQESGKDPSAIAAIMQEFDRLMQKRAPKQAEAVLDHALEQLKAPE